jgi:putative ABC transport system ATP-binding protein
MIAPSPQPPTERVIVRVEGVHKAFRQGTTVTPVLNDVELIVRGGDCVFLAGPSGSGKTTLLSIIGCICSADRGRISILDVDIATLGFPELAALRRDRIGFVFQRFHLVRGLTALENVCVPLILRGDEWPAARRRALPLLEAVGLENKAKTHPRNMSAGQCQRVAIARALAADPDLILADEPTASLDATNGQEVMELLRRLITERGKTAIVVTHDQRIFHYADKVYWLENGRIVQTREPVGAEMSNKGSRANHEIGNV